MSPQDMAKGRYFIDAVVTMVDAKNIGRHLKGKSFGAHSPEAERQISLADIILINKIDLVNENELSLLEHSINVLNPVASFFKCSFSRVDPSSILDVRAFNKDKILQRLPDLPSQNPEHGNCILNFSFFLLIIDIKFHVCD